MSSPSPNGDDTRSGGGRFEQTQWTIILAARKEGEPGAQEAMETFARTYWPAIYRYIRRDGHNAHEAEDLTQGFYAHFLGRQLLNGVGERTGRFRNYLLTCLKHFLSDERDRGQALKRRPEGGIVSRDAMEAEERDALEPRDDLTPAQLFERRWAQALLAQAVARLRREYADDGRAALYDALKDVPAGEHGERTYAEIGAPLGLSEQAVKNAVHRLRRRHREILREEIAQTVNQPSEIEGEIQHLMTVIAR